MTRWWQDVGLGYEPPWQPSWSLRDGSTSRCWQAWGCPWHRRAWPTSPVGASCDGKAQRLWPLSRARSAGSRSRCLPRCRKIPCRRGARGRRGSVRLSRTRTARRCGSFSRRSSLPVCCRRRPGSADRGGRAASPRARSRRRRYVRTGRRDCVPIGRQTPLRTDLMLTLSYMPVGPTAGQCNPDDSTASGDHRDKSDLEVMKSHLANVQG